MFSANKQQPPSDDMVRSVNLEYYLRQQPGREDYWRKMAAPRFRISTFLKILATQRPKTLVDMGCGSGELLFEIRRFFPGLSLCGLDLAPWQIESNRLREPSIEWRMVDLDEGQDFPPELLGRFDIVMAAEIIEHVLYPDIFLRNALMLSRHHGGKLVLSTQSGNVRETERRVGHRRHFSSSEMGELLKASGWKPLHIWNTGWPFHDLSKLIANINPDRTMKQFSEQHYTLMQNVICWGLRQVFRLNSMHRGNQLFAIAEKE